MPANLFRRILKRFEPGHQNVSKQQKTIRAWIVLAEAPQDAGSDNLAESCATDIDILTVVQMLLFVEELGPIDEEAVYFGNG